MKQVRYRSYLIRVWEADGTEWDAARARIEWIARGVEAEVRGSQARDLAARLAGAFGPEAPAGDTAVGVAAEAASREGE